VPSERGLPFVGYTGVLVVFISASSLLVRAARHPPGETTPLAVLLLALGLVGWALGNRLSSPQPSLGRCLLLLRDALLPLALLAFALAGLGGAQVTPIAKVAPFVVAVGAFLGLAALHLARGRVVEPLYPYFLGAIGAGLLYLSRLLGGWPIPALLWVVLGLVLLLRVAATRADGEPHFSLAGGALLAAAALAAGARQGLDPQRDLLVALYALAAASFLIAFRSGSLGPACRTLGFAAYLLATVAFTVTLRYLHAPLAAYFAATAAWVVVLALAGVLLRADALEPVRDSAHWLAVVLGGGLALLARRAWWPWSRPTGFQDETQLAAAWALLAVGIALAAVSLWRRRHPPIAASALGFLGNIALSWTASYAAPLIAVAGGSALWIAAGGDSTETPLVSLSLGALLLALPAGVERSYGSLGLAFAGAVAVVLPSLIAPETGPVMVPVLAALVFFQRSLRRRTRWSHAAFFAMVAFAAFRMTRSVAGSPDLLGLALLSVALLLAYRLLQYREGTRPRTAWVVVAGASTALVCLFLAVTTGPVLAAALLVLWLGTPALLAAEDRGRGRIQYEPVVFLTDWVEGLAFLVAYGAGALLVVLLWRAQGLPPLDIGPLLAAWALAHLALHRWLEARRPRHSWTTATDLAAWSLVVVALGFAFRGSSAAVAVSTLLLSAAFFLLRGGPLPSGAFAPLHSWIGYTLSFLAIYLAGLAGGGLLPRTLVGAALLYLWHSWRTRGLGVHSLFLIALTAAAVAPPIPQWAGPRTLLVSLAAVVLLVVSAITEALEGRNSRVRLTEVWALVVAAAVIARDLSLARFSPWVYLTLWAAFLVGALRWDARTPSHARPGEPEDDGIGIAGYGVAHAAGGAAIVSILLALRVSLGVAAAALAAWAWLHLGLARWLARRLPERLAAAAILPAVHAFALASLVVAAFARRDGTPAVLACALTGLLYFVVSGFGTRPLFVRLGALALVEGACLLGWRAGVTVPEYYLSALAVFFYVVLPARREAPGAVDRSWLLSGPSGWIREAQGHLLPALILVLTVGYAFWALVRTREEVHLFSLGTAAAALLVGFARAGQALLYSWLACALFLAGALYLFATRDLSPAGSLFLLAAGTLVILTLRGRPAALEAEGSGR
jgi:hypothetical protein